MDIHHRHILFLMLSLLIIAGCNKDDEYKEINNQNSKDDTHPFQRGSVVAEDTAEFNFLEELFGYSSSAMNIEIEEKKDGRIKINGYASNESTISITFNWGDGNIIDGWFPQEHIYTDISKNYYVTVTANYGPDLKDYARILVRFVPPNITRVPIPPEIAVTIPDQKINLGTRLYGISDDFNYFEERYFDQYIPRADLEYILSVTAWIQYEFVNRDVYLIDGAFNQVVLKNPNGGFGSLWFTNPPSFICDDFGSPG